MRVVHLAQTHAFFGDGFKPTQELFDQTVHSQWVMAQLIKQNPHCAVVTENVFQDLTYREYSRGRGIRCGPYELTVAKINKIFPKGLPNQLGDLNRAQKEALYCFGAGLVLLFLNIIPVLYDNSVDKNIALTLQVFLDTEAREAEKTGLRTQEYLQKFDRIDALREKDAVAAVIRAAKIHYKEVEKSTIVIIIYGSAHSFESHCLKNGLNYQKVYTAPRQIKCYNPAITKMINLAGSPFWKDSDLCDPSKVNANKIKQQDSVEFSLPGFQMILGLCTTLFGAALLATYCFAALANPVIMLVLGLLSVVVGLIICINYLLNRYNQPMETLGVVLEGEEGSPLPDPARSVSFWRQQWGLKDEQPIESIVSSLSLNPV